MDDRMTTRIYKYLIIEFLAQSRADVTVLNEFNMAVCTLHFCIHRKRFIFANKKKNIWRQVSVCKGFAVSDWNSFIPFGEIITND